MDDNVLSKLNSSSSLILVDPFLAISFAGVTPQQFFHQLDIAFLSCSSSRQITLAIDSNYIIIDTGKEII